MPKTRYQLQFLAFSSLPWILGVLWIVAALPLIASLPFNADEGVNLLLAREIVQGATPFRDFFYHQFPLFLYFLAANIKIGIVSLFGNRMLSLLAIALTGIILHFLLRKRFGRFAGVAVQLTYYIAPVNWDVTLVMPNAFGTFFLILGILCLVQTKARIALGALFWNLAVFIKPNLALAVLVLFCRPGQKKRDRILTLSLGFVFACVVLALLYWLSNGSLIDLFLFQWNRHSGAQGFDSLVRHTGLSRIAHSLGVESSLEWNTMVHYRNFWQGRTDYFPNPGLLNPSRILLYATTLAGLHTLLRSIQNKLDFTDWITWLPLFMLIFFNFFLISPAWSHYLAFYPPFMALAIVRSLSLFQKRTWLYLWMLIIAFCIPAYFADPAQNYAKSRLVSSYRLTNTSILSFDPVVTFLLGKPPACGLIDPSNVYDTLGTAVLGDSDYFRHFQLSRQTIQNCLDRQPELKLWIDDYFDLFTYHDYSWCKWVISQPPDKLVFTYNRRYVSACHMDN